MHLLKKSTIQSEAQRERKKQIDEGIFIAQKVDALRQTLGNLQAQNAKFLSEVEGELEKRTQPLLQKINYLKEEITDLEEKRKLLLVPLDKEWTEFHKKQASQNDKEKSLNSKGEVLSQKAEKLKEIGLGLKGKLFKVKTRERELIKTQSLAEENLYLSKMTKKEAEDLKKHSIEEAKEITQDLKDREAKVAVKEREVEMITKSQDSRQIEQDEREKWLKDRNETLQRTINRNNR